MPPRCHSSLEEIQKAQVPVNPVSPVVQDATGDTDTDGGVAGPTRWISETPLHRCDMLEMMARTDLLCEGPIDLQEDTVLAALLTAAGAGGSSPQFLCSGGFGFGIGRKQVQESC